MRKDSFSTLKKYWDIIFLGFFSFLTRFLFLSYPAKVVFDEAHFGLYATKYLSHQYYFDIHPPLGKMLLALAGLLGKINPGFQFEENAPYGDFNFLALRFLPAFFGSLLVLLAYLLVKELGGSRRTAFLAGFFVLFDNAFLIQSRFILLDTILIFFIFLSLYLFLLSRKFPAFSKKWHLFHVLCGLSLAAAVSIKWTGLGILALVWFLLFFQDKIMKRPKKEIFAKFFFLLFIPLFLYLCIFFAHFSILNSTCQENCGWVFDRYLPVRWGLDSPPGNIFAKTAYDNFFSLSTHPVFTSFYYASDPWSWPFLIRPVLYFKEVLGNKTSFIYFMGNPAVWWLAFLGMLGFFYLRIKKFFIPIAGYLIYTVPFLFVKRFMVIYHYLPALVFSIILAAFFFEKLMENKSNAFTNICFAAILIIVFLSFVYFSPFTYGFPLTDHGYQNRMWLDTWSLIDS